VVGFAGVGDEAPLCVVLLIGGEPFGGGWVVGEEKAVGLIIVRIYTYRADCEGVEDVWVGCLHTWRLLRSRS
jgi:hypothetical protein